MTYFLKNYLNKLQKFTLTDVSKNKLISQEQIKKIAEFNFSGYMNFSMRKIDFDFIKSNDFQTFFKNLFNNSDVVYLIIEGAREFGALPLSSINVFNFDFDFSADKNGVLILIDNQFSYYVLLDWYSENNQEFFDIDIKSTNNLTPTLVNLLQK